MSCSVASSTALLKWSWRRRVKKIPCSLCLFLPSSFQEWSLFGSRMTKETFALDQFRQQAGDKHSLKENQQQRKKPKHPKWVVTWQVLPFLPLSMQCHPHTVKRWMVTATASQELGSVPACSRGWQEQCFQGMRRWKQLSPGASGAGKGCSSRRE